MLNNFYFSEIGNDIMLNIVTLYKESTIILLMILYIVLAIILFIIENFNHEENKFPIYFSKKAESTLDIIFVMFPTLVVAYLIFPAVGFLYNTEYIMSQVETLFDVSIIGHQWYWSYEYNINICNESILKILGDEFIHEKLTFDSLINMNSIDARLLSVDKKLILPSNTFINLMITSEDVIHSWALPQFGIKIDAVPGRIAEYVFFANFNGIYYGQCSELCGVNHGFMPISVETVPYFEFLDFLLVSLNFNPSALILELYKLYTYNIEEEDENRVIKPEPQVIDNNTKKGIEIEKEINNEIKKKAESELKEEIINEEGNKEVKEEIINEEGNKEVKEEIINKEVEEEVGNKELKEGEIGNKELKEEEIKNKEIKEEEIGNEEVTENIENEKIKEEIRNEEINKEIEIEIEIKEKVENEEIKNI
jgi:cytochrome c oxidase subunit 2